MPIFPSYVTILSDGYGEDHSPVAARTEMDRGIAKQRKTQSDVIIQVPLSLIFDNNVDADAFEDWFYGDAAAGAAWFDWTDPRTGALRSARAVANTLGPLAPVSGLFMQTTRKLTIEYLRAL